MKIIPKIFGTLVLLTSVGYAGYALYTSSSLNNGATAIIFELVGFLVFLVSAYLDKEKEIKKRR